MLNLTNITGAEVVEVRINDNGSTLWVNTEQGCVLRICQIKYIQVEDNRRRRKPCL